MKRQTTSQKPPESQPVIFDLKKIEEFHSAVRALQVASTRLMQSIEAVHGPPEHDALTGAARVGLVLVLGHPGHLIGNFDPSKLTVELDSELNDAIADAMTDLAALARVSGLDEEYEFGRRVIYFPEFEEPGVSAE